jgi:hypothetical protein
MSRLTGADAYGLMEAYQAVYAPQELTEEQVLEEVETWVNSLLEEGYDLSDYTWEEVYESYLVNEFNTIVGGLIEEGYDLSEYTEQELFDALISEKKGLVSGIKNAGAYLGGAFKNVWNQMPKNAPKQLGIPKAPSSSVPYGNRTLPGTPARPALPAAAKAPAPSKGGSLAATKPNSSSMTAPLGSKSNPNPIRTNLNVPGGPGGNKNGKRAAGLGLGLLGLGALTSMNRGDGSTGKPAPLASTTVPGKGGSPRRKEQLVGGKGSGELTATGSIVSQAKNLNKKGGISLGSGGSGYLAKKGDKLVTVQARGIGADDGIIGKAARKLGLTKDKDKALEAQRQSTSRANREKYLQAQGLTDKNVTGYQAKGAIRKGEKTGLNINASYEYDTFDTVLEYLIAEGYADTEESALVIMANMSEEWRESIMEGPGGMKMSPASQGGGQIVKTQRELGPRPSQPVGRKPVGRPAPPPPVGATVTRYDSGGKQYTHIQK